MKIAVIGAGNGGQAYAAYLASKGHEVSLCDRNVKVVEALKRLSEIHLEGKLHCSGKPALVTDDMAQAIKGVELVMVTTTANAHKDLARQMAPYIADNQVVVLNPGRTGGALEFKQVLRENGVKKRVYLAEAQTLVFACRIVETGVVNIIGVKDRVLLSAYPSSDTQYVLGKLACVFDCFKEAANVLETSFENYGAIFHPSVVLFNEAAIERGNEFYFYRDMTPGLANLIESIDNERLAVANAYGIHPVSASDWVAYAYDNIEGTTLCERMRNNPAYYEILAPTKIDCRQITEDIPTGLVPISEFGKAANVPTPLMDAIITLCSELLQRDFRKEGRNLKNLGFEGFTPEEIIRKINNETA